jgi:hypothetical protein
MKSHRKRIKPESELNLIQRHSKGLSMAKVPFSLNSLCIFKAHACFYEGN